MQCYDRMLYIYFHFYRMPYINALCQDLTSVDSPYDFAGARTLPSPHTLILWQLRKFKFTLAFSRIRAWNFVVFLRCLASISGHFAYKITKDFRRCWKLRFRASTFKQCLVRTPPYPRWLWLPRSTFLSVPVLMWLNINIYRAAQFFVHKYLGSHCSWRLKK